MNDLVKDCTNETADFIATLASDELSAYSKTKEEIKAFKSCLKSITEDLTLKGYHTPLTIFVDELDRCRPSYAVDLLESIKHLFNVPNVVFVLAIDKSQLLASIKGIYGNELNSQVYLRKFIDLDYNLPPPTIDVFAKLLAEKYGITQLLDSHESPTGESTKSIINDIIKLADHFKLSLRDIEQLYTQLFVIFNSYRNYPYISFAIILSACKLYNNPLYQDIIRKEIPAHIALDKLGLSLNTKPDDYYHTFFYVYSSTMINASLNGDAYVNNRLNELEAKFKASNSETTSLSMEINVLKSTKHPGPAIIFQKCIDIVEMTSKFTLPI